MRRDQPRGRSVSCAVCHIHTMYRDLDEGLPADGMESKRQAPAPEAGVLFVAACCRSPQPRETC